MTRGSSSVWMHRRPLLVYGLTHAAVDATSSALVFASLRGAGQSSAAGAVVLYNVAAFAVQPFVGLVLDGRRGLRPARAAAVGGLATAAGILALAVWPQPYLLAVWAGLGNALFHVGCGIPVLRMTPGRAGAVGVFVAPGALGLGTGVAVGRAGGPVWLICAVLVVLCVLVWATAGCETSEGVSTVPAGSGGRGAEPRDHVAASAAWLPGGRTEWVVTALLVVVATRSFLGTALVFPWRTATSLQIGLTVVSFAGKAAGGLLADRFGRRQIGVGALLGAIPLLAAGPGMAAAGLAGVFLVNATMPITLTAAADRLPAHPGFAFGLTCLALMLGAFPAYVGAGLGTAPAAPLAALLVAAALLLWWGLRASGPASVAVRGHVGEDTAGEGVT